jgi:hypothetical protein
MRIIPSRHDSIRRLESFTKDALSITKMIEERKRMMHYRSRSTDSTHDRSREPSHDDADAEDDVILPSSGTMNRTSRRRILRKKRPQYNNQLKDEDDEEKNHDDNQNFDSSRRRLSR